MSTKLCVWLIGFSLLVAPASAIAQMTWRTVGPGAGSFLMSVAIDPADPDVIYVGGDIEGIYKSTDGGATWGAANQGMNSGNRPAGVYAVQELIIDPSSTQTLYAGTWSGLFKSTDGAQNWTWIFPTERSEDEDPIPVSYVAVDPDNPLNVYAGVGDADANSDGRGALYRSTDGGTSWSLLDTGMDEEAVVHSILIDPTSPADNRQLFVSTDTGLSRSQDNGSSWTPINTGLPHTNARRLALCNSGGQITLFLSLSTEGDSSNPSSLQGGIYKSTDNGGSWTSINGDLPTVPYEDPEDPPPAYDYWKYVVHPTDPAILYAATNLGGWGDLWGVHKTTDGGNTWTKVDTDITYGWMDSAWWNEGNISLLEISSSNPEILIAGGDFLRRSSDGGETWQQVYTEKVGSGWRGRGIELMESFSQAFHPTDADVIYIAYDDMGLWRSDDGGSSFLRLDPTQKPGGYDSVNSIVVDPETDDLYISRDNGENDADLDPQYSIGRLLKSTDRGVTWTDLGENLPAGRSILVLDTTSPANARILYVAIYGQGVYKTGDGGESWVSASSGLGSGSSKVWSLSLHPAESQTLYAGLNSLQGEGTGGLYKTTDGGQNWTKLDGASGLDVLSVAVDPSGRVYVGATDNHSWSLEGGLFRSTDEGTTWQNVLDQPRVGLVLVDPEDPEIVYAASQPWWNFVSGLDAGFYRSADAGDAWEQVNTDLGHTFVLSGVISPHNTDQILVGTHGGGVWLGEIPASAPAPPTADFNGSGKVDFFDFIEFALNFGKKQEDPNFDQKYDLDGGGEVDFLDFLEFVQAFEI